MIYTIGHSVHPIDKFITLLQQYNIKGLIDIRRYPFSKRYPQYNREVLSEAINRVDIDYYHIEALGGMRSSESEDKSLGQFSGYIAYMKTDEFKNGLSELLSISERCNTAYMCSEGNWKECHRSILSDELTRQGHTVIHITPLGDTQQHTFTDAALKMMQGKLF